MSSDYDTLGYVQMSGPLRTVDNGPATITIVCESPSSVNHQATPGQSPLPINHPTSPDQSPSSKNHSINPDQSPSSTNHPTNPDQSPSSQHQPTDQSQTLQNHTIDPTRPSLSQNRHHDQPLCQNLPSNPSQASSQDHKRHIDQSDTSHNHPPNSNQALPSQHRMELLDHSSPRQSQQTEPDQSSPPQNQPAKPNNLSSQSQTQQMDPGQSSQSQCQQTGPNQSPPPQSQQTQPDQLSSHQNQQPETNRSSQTQQTEPYTSSPSDSQPTNPNQSSSSTENQSSQLHCRQVNSGQSALAQNYHKEPAQPNSSVQIHAKEPEQSSPSTQSHLAESSEPSTSPQISQLTEIQTAITSPVGSSAHGEQEGEQTGTSTQDDPTCYAPNATDSTEYSAGAADALSIAIGSEYSVLPPFVDARTCERPLSLRGPRVHRSLVLSNEPDYTDVDRLLALHQDPLSRASTRQTLLVKTLSYLASRGDMESMCEFVTAPDIEVSVRNAAIIHLERLLLGHQYSSGVASVTAQLRSVAQNTLAAFLGLNDRDPNLTAFGCLHFMAVSALLGRCNCTDIGLVLPSKQTEDSKSKKHVLLEALRTFYSKNFDDKGKFRRSSSFRCTAWTEEDEDKEAHERRRKEFSSATFCKAVVFSFSLLNELMNVGWDFTGKKLLEIMKELVEEVSASRQCKEAMATFNVLLVRGLVTLLNTTFEEAYPQVGQLPCNHTEIIVDLILSIINNPKDPNQALYEQLHQEIDSLALHSSQHVRKTIGYFLRSKNQSLSRVALSHLHSSLQPTGFQWDVSQSPACDGSAWDECTWIKIEGRFGQKKVVGALFAPKPGCMANNLDIEKCMKEHPGQKEKLGEKRDKKAEDARWNRKNMETLIELNEGNGHLVQLLAYQFLPVPFYVTECIEKEYLLLTRLLDHRNNFRLLSMGTFICIVQSLVSALLFLEDRKIVARDITTYNIVVYSTDGSQSGSQEERWVLQSGNFVIKLASLGSAHKFQDCSRLSVQDQTECRIRPVRDTGRIPVRWTSPEALFEGLFSPESMVYAVGCVLYELFTYGCEPFTSYEENTETLLHQMFMKPESIRLNDWPCIPEKVRSLIKQCTEPDPQKRPSLQDVMRELHSVLLGEAPDSSSEMMTDAHRWKKGLPSPRPDQENRRHIPEMGIPESIQRLIQDGKKSAEYVNTNKENWSETENTAVTKEELATPDWLYIENRCGHTLVKECVSSSFVQEVLPSIYGAGNLPGVTCWNKKPIEQRMNENWQHVRKYPPSKDLQTAACRNYLWEGEDDPYDKLGTQADPPYLTVFIRLASHLDALHERGFLLRDIRPSYILVVCKDGEVFLPRIGRMCQIPPSDTFVVDEPFVDSWRWSAPEVLLSGKYSKASDVYALATTFWQTFHIRDVFKKDPIKDSEKRYVPFADLDKGEVLARVREHQPLPIPKDFPDYLHNLVHACRDPDPSKRPTAHAMLRTLHGHSTLECRPSPFFSDPRCCPVALPDNEPVNGNASPPALPSRESRIPVPSHRKAKPCGSNSEYAHLKQLASASAEGRHPGYHRLNESRPESVRWHREFVGVSTNTEMSVTKNDVRDEECSVENRQKESGSLDRGSRPSVFPKRACSTSFSHSPRPGVFGDVFHISHDEDPLYTSPEASSVEPPQTYPRITRSASLSGGLTRPSVSSIRECCVKEALDACGHVQCAQQGLEQHTFQSRNVSLTKSDHTAPAGKIIHYRDDPQKTAYLVNSPTANSKYFELELEQEQSPNDGIGTILGSNRQKMNHLYFSDSSSSTYSESPVVTRKPDNMDSARHMQNHNTDKQRSGRDRVNRTRVEGHSRIPRRVNMDHDVDDLYLTPVSDPNPTEQPQNHARPLPSTVFGKPSESPLVTRKPDNMDSARHMQNHNTDKQRSGRDRVNRTRVEGHSRIPRRVNMDHDVDDLYLTPVSDPNPTAQPQNHARPLPSTVFGKPRSAESEVPRKYRPRTGVYYQNVRFQSAGWGQNPVRGHRNGTHGYQSNGSPTKGTAKPKPKAPRGKPVSFIDGIAFGQDTKTYSKQTKKQFWQPVSLPTTPMPQPQSSTCEDDKNDHYDKLWPD